MQSATAILSGNLPAEPNSFIGRERDLAELARLLGEVRALTLSGPCGIGKTPRAARGTTAGRGPPLDLPPDGARGAELAAHEAVRLFAARAAGARPGFTLTKDNTASVARLCRTLDGIPLGIELSAARVRALSVEQIADRMRDRFQLLDSGDRTAPPRQQTLRATVDWSYELLDEPEQILLRRLAVFSGRHLDIAEQVCSDDAIPADTVLGLLISLIDKSLVVLDGEAAGDARYRLLGPIRAYAAARPGPATEQSSTSLRHPAC